MPSKFDTERLVGLQLRAISGDITREFSSSVLNEIFEEGYREWAFNIGAYIRDEEKKQRYINLIILFQKKKIDLNNSKIWKLLMQREMPIEFFKMFDKFTQVPQLSARNKAKPKIEEGEEEWFKL